MTIRNFVTRVSKGIKDKGASSRVIKEAAVGFFVGESAIQGRISPLLFSGRIRNAFSQVRYDIQNIFSREPPVDDVLVRYTYYDPVNNVEEYRVARVKPHQIQRFSQDPLGFGDNFTYKRDSDISKTSQAVDWEIL